VRRMTTGPSTASHPLRAALPAFALAFVACAEPPAARPSASAPRGTAARAATTAAPRPTALAPLLAEISAERLSGYVEHLVGFGTRHTLSDATSKTRGIGAAREWIRGDFAESPRLQVSLDKHVQAADGARIPRETEIVNVVAVLPGSMPAAANRRYYVMGHYDSRVADVMDATSDAPGANDDASGVAVVLELARVMARHSYDATIVFMANAGEEQGLYGAKLHAKAAHEQHLDIRAVLNDDIVGDPSDPAGGRHDRAIRVFSGGLPTAATPEEVAQIRKLGGESDSPSRELARYVAEVARAEHTEIEPRLVFRYDRFLRGGDHLPFVDEGYPAVRFTTVAETFTRQHAPTDQPKFVDGAYLSRVARLEAAVLAHLANAPSAPPRASVVTAELQNDTTLRWEASPEPDVAGYEIVWRRTTSPEWEEARDAGAQLSARVPVSKDDVFFGVRAYDRDGNKSPVTFAGTSR